MTEEKIKVLAASGDDKIFVPALQEFLKKSGCELRDFFSGASDPGITPRLKELFPGVVFHELVAAAKGALPGQRGPGEVPVVAPETIQRFAAAERVFMQMLDIYDPGGTAFSGRERRETYYDVLRYVLDIFERRRPDFVIFGLIPHALYDYLLLAACDVFGVKYIFIQSIFIPGCVLPYHTLAGGNHKVSGPGAEALSPARVNEVFETLPPHVKDYFEKLRLDYSLARPPHMAIFVDRDSGSVLATLKKMLPLPFVKGNYTRTLLYWALQLARVAGQIVANPSRGWKRYFRDETPEPFKEPGVPYRKARTTVFRSNLIRVRNHVFQWRLKRQYAKLAIRPDLTRNYFYFPLHYQPEATTYPLGLDAIDLSVPIRMVSAMIPDDWTIYVKEHPCTFDTGANRGGFFARDYNYYQDLLEIPKVKLVDIQTDSFQLADHAQAVGTLTGRPGWEAVYRGRPALVFGAAWYRGCDGVYEVATREQCEAALAEIRAGRRPDPAKVREFAARTLAHSYFYDIYSGVPLARVPLEESIRRMADSFWQEYAYFFGARR